MYNNYNDENQNNTNAQNNENVQNEQNTSDAQNGQYTYGEQNTANNQYSWQNRNGNNQNDYYGYNRNNMNEFSYNPDPKKPKHKKLLTALVVSLCVVALGATSVVGFSILSGNTIDSVFKSDESSTTQSSSGKTQATTTKTKRENLPTLIQLATPEDAMQIPDIVEKVSPSVVGISCMTNSGTVTGTGIIMSEDGYIITNAHVVEDATAISVVLPSNYTNTDESSSAVDEDNSIKAELIGKDTQTDIAVIKIEKTGLTAVEFGTSAEVQVGEVSIVIGNPLGLDLANSVTAGIISATDRTITIEDRTMNLIQTDASINSGNSGGPLINAYGQVIGITSAKVASSYGEGLGFAIPIDEAIPIVKELMENGYVTGRPTLGISGMNISDVYSQYYDVPKGFIVKVVESGSAAEQAGIQQNDIIVGIEGTLIESIEEFNAIKEKYKAGDEITVSLYRNDKIVDVQVVLGEAVEDDASTQSQQQTLEDYYNYYGGFGY